MATGVEELLDMLFEMIDEAKSMPLSSDKCILERDKALEAIAKIDIMTENGIIVCESAAESALPELAAPYAKGRDYRYGKIKITLYHRAV